MALIKHGPHRCNSRSIPVRQVYLIERCCIAEYMELIITTEVFQDEMLPSKTTALSNMDSMVVTEKCLN